MSDKPPQIKRFSLKRKTIPIELEMQDGTIKNFTMKEPLGNSRENFLDNLQQRMKTKEDGTPIGIKSHLGFFSGAISMVLYDDQEQMVPPTVIAEWPSGVQSSLFEMAQDLLALGKDEKEKAKNESRASGISG